MPSNILPFCKTNFLKPGQPVAVRFNVVRLLNYVAIALLVVMFLIRRYYSSHSQKNNVHPDVIFPSHSSRSSHLVYLLPR